MENHLEKLLAKHCGPVLLGLKPGTIFTLVPLNFQEAAATLMELNRDLRIIRLGVCNGRWILFVYFPNKLTLTLRQEIIQEFLDGLGYPQSENLGEKIIHLKQRFGEDGSFPHEVGFFLGYPPEDVIGFVRNKGCDYKYCGLWKVYGDVGYAKRFFATYKKCRENMEAHIENGGHLKDFAVVGAGLSV